MTALSQTLPQVSATVTADLRDVHKRLAFHHWFRWWMHGEWVAHKFFTRWF